MPALPTLVLYHADCPDGFGAAWSYWRVLGDRARYVPYDYTRRRRLPDLAGEDVLMVDVSDTPERLQQICQQARSFRLIDHHDSAFSAVGDQPFAHFDLSHSGAWLAWKDLHGSDSTPPRLIRMIEARDLLNWNEPYSREALFVLDSLPHDFQAWDAFHDQLENDFERVLSAGQAMAAQYDRLIERLANQACDIVLAGVPAKIVNAPHLFANDVGARLHERLPLAMSWYADDDGQVHLSFRADKHRFSIVPLAEALMGGGSPGSGAARVSLDLIDQMYAGKDVLAHRTDVVATMAPWLERYAQGSAPLTLEDPR